MSSQKGDAFPLLGMDNAGVRHNRLIAIATATATLVAIGITVGWRKTGELDFLYAMNPRSVKITETAVRGDRTNRSLSFTFPWDRSDAVVSELRQLAKNKGWRMAQFGANGSISGDRDGFYIIRWERVSQGAPKLDYFADGTVGDLRVTVHQNEPWWEQKLHELRRWLHMTP